MRSLHILYLHRYLQWRIHLRRAPQKRASTLRRARRANRKGLRRYRHDPRQDPRCPAFLFGPIRTAQPTTMRPHPHLKEACSSYDRHAILPANGDLGPGSLGEGIPTSFRMVFSPLPCRRKEEKEGHRPYTKIWMHGKGPSARKLIGSQIYEAAVGAGVPLHCFILSRYGHVQGPWPSSSATIPSIHPSGAHEIDRLMMLVAVLSQLSNLERRA